MQPDFSKQLLLALLAYASGRGIAPEPLCTGSGIAYPLLLQPGASGPVSPQQWEQLWKNLAYRSGDPLIGLHFGEAMQLSALGLVGQIIQTSSTVGDALTQAGTLVPLITDLFSIRLEHEGNIVTIHLLPDSAKAGQYPHSSRQWNDYLMAFIVHELDGLLLHRIRPKTVSFPYGAVPAQEYQRVFRCPVGKHPGSSCIGLDKAWLEQPVLSAQYELQQFLLQQIGHQPAGEGAGASLHRRIYRYLLTNSYLYALSLEAVAANFCMSPRTLQRKLKEEGVSFLEVVEEVRAQLARSYLASGNHSVKDVAYFLGYQEPGAFIRAFKRWTGQTPAAYTKRQVAQQKQLAD
ncbi:MAG TPA: AraC family transcriptional regulator [Chitinophagaceae bacterium]|jgi:AraC-like DNA-binding protein|nr:AraC family transcriptional regulator [Chitinophagaceae bacterium]